MADKKPLRIAIIGGSMGGLTLAIGLHRLQRLDLTFDVFESWSFKERGAGVGVHRNGQNALRQMGIDADELLEKADAFKEKAAEAKVAYGEHEGKSLFELPDSGVQCVLRTDLLEEMLKLLPEERLHAQKKVVSMDEGESLTLHFEDGTTHEADAVIGSDGLRSTVRKFVLGNDHPAVPPKFTGYWDARAFMSGEDCLKAWGPEVIQLDNPREHFVVGDGCTMLFASAPAGKPGGMVAAGYAHEEEREMIDNPKKPLTREFLEKHYGGWGKSYVKGVIDSLLDSNCGPGVLFGEYESQDAPTWCRDRICIMGDAAHAALPWMGQGFSMAAEDCAVMTTLLSAVQSREDFAKAFKAFDSTRRGPQSRTAFVVKHGNTMAPLCSGQRGLDPEVALKGLPDINSLFEYLWEVDMKAECEKALRVFEESKSQ